MQKHIYTYPAETRVALEHFVSRNCLLEQVGGGMSSPRDIRLLWNLGRLPPRGGGGDQVPEPGVVGHDCRLGGGGGQVPEPGLGEFSLALATLGSGRVLRLRKSFYISCRIIITIR